ncbi:putative siderophore iron transporter [Talaromyces proteolyticus]|uniref:Siderophore iron transporter n=1 Tax=Talaromyces proteolyticus TaxID=1131652 RepID=A0AAD4Q1J4_9EURO|nr:putative siderophore iron transporter [Talaromyces proteolyticus]KAH8698608.1 putative siderophore iron transporter [Talaromyces proteolyticus]
MTSPGLPEDPKAFDMKAISQDAADVESVAIADGKSLSEDKKQLPGLADLDGIQRSWNLQNLIVIWISALLMSFATNLNNQTSSSFASYATSDFASAPLLGTVTVVQAVASAVALQPLARLADVYGRFEMLSISVILLTIGEIMIASSKSVGVYAGAQVFWAFGYIGISLMLQILAGDTSDLHNRALINAIPIAPSLVTCWSSIPVISLPILASLYHNKRKGTMLRKEEGTYKPRNHVQNFLQLDPLGLILFGAGLALVLIPISLAPSNENNWKTTHTIVELVIGSVCLIALVIWETKWARWPILSMKVLKNRTVIFGLIGPSANKTSAMFINYSGLYILQSYLLMYELIAANLSVNAATNIYILIPFAGSLGQLMSGLLVKYLKRYKWVVVSGYGLIVLGMGLTYKYVNGNGQMPQLVVSQLILGIGEGFVMTTQFGIQASIDQSEMAAGTALFTTSVAVGNAVGAAIAGGMWTTLLPRKLSANLPAQDASYMEEIAASITSALSFEWGTPTRDAINNSFTSTFRDMILVGLILVAVAFLCSLLLQNFNISEVDSNREYKGIVIGKTGAVDALKDKVNMGHAEKHPTTKEDA